MNSVYKKMFELRQLVGKVTKNKENKFLKNSYADLNAVLEVSDPAIYESGLLWLDRVEDKTLVTEIIDIESGEMIISRTPLIMQKEDMQSLGSALSFARRYIRLTVLNMATVDDDGSVASGQSFAKPVQIKKIQELLLSSKTDSQKFLAHYRVSSIKEMYEAAAVDALKTLELKLSKMGAE